MKDKDVKSKCRNRLCFIPMILVALFLANCQDDEAKMVFDPGIPVQITGFSPDTGGAGTQLVISGRNFGTEKELIKVMVGKSRREASIIGSDGNHIYAVVAARSDTGRIYVEVGAEGSVRKDSSKTEFSYQIQENVSTYSGTGDRETLDGVRLGSSDEAARYDCPHYMTIDDEGVIYVLEGDQEGTADNQGLRIINGDEVTSGFRRSNKDRQGRFRSICFSMSQDTLFLAQDDGDVNKAAFFISTRNNSFQDLTEVVTGTNQCNTVAVNPVTGELFFNSFGRGITYRYNFKEGKPNYGMFITYTNKDANQYFKEDNYILENVFDLEVIHIKRLNQIPRNIIFPIMIVLASLVVVYTFFAMKSKVANEINIIGVYREIGFSKSSLIKKYSIDTSVLTFFTSFVGYFLVTVCCSIFASIAKIYGLNIINVLLYPSTYIILVSLLILNLIFGLLPIQLLMRKTPSEIISKYDI